MIRPPFNRIPESRYCLLYVTLLLVTLVVMFEMSRSGRLLATDESRVTVLKNEVRGIVAFELAGDQATAARIIESWKQAGLIEAAFSNLRFDYLFLLCYSACLAVACVLATQWLRWLGVQTVIAGTLLAWAQFVAAGFDAIENFALLSELSGSLWTGWPVIAYWCAVPKFLIVLAGFIYFLAGIVGGWLGIALGRDAKPVGR
ncbi:MAG: hypothetical protein U0Z53_04095 [Blastocatellia bacterium]